MAEVIASCPLLWKKFLHTQNWYGLGTAEVGNRAEEVGAWISVDSTGGWSIQLTAGDRVFWDLRYDCRDPESLKDEAERSLGQWLRGIRERANG